MSTQRLLQITVATLAALATVLLSMGQRSVALPMLVATAAFLSVWLTDVKGWFRLKRLPAGIAAVVALLFCLRNLFPLHPLTAILEIAGLLVYLQVILLFQKKQLRAYWQLFLLSLLQVVVATVFNQGIWFGLLMAVYMFTALLALALLCLVREERRHRVGAAAASGAEDSAASEVEQWDLSTPPPDRIAAAAFPARELFLRVGMLSLGTLVLTATAFFALPRLGQPAWRGENGGQRRSVGYSNEVALGELGLIIENPQEVMRIQFVDPEDGRRIEVLGDIYLHGAALTSYEKGRWSNPTPPRGEAQLQPRENPPQTGVVRQMISIEPMDRRELFCIRPYFIAQSNPSLRVSGRSERLLRSREYIDRRFTFFLDTTGIADSRQTAFAPVDESPPVEDLLRMPSADSPSGLPNLAKLADQWMAEVKLPRDNWQSRAQYLKQRLSNDERFQYSLEGQPRDWEIDPIEDFIVNNPKGHCEYFATALTLMLRSQGIPARMAVGYKCDEFNRLGGFFQVRQLHAHTWVEVYLPREKLPPALREDESLAGAWMRLDPTPPAASDRSLAHPWLAPLAGSLEWLEFAWDNYVMEMDRSRQQEAIYQPLLNWAKTTLAKLKDPHWWRGLAGKILYVLNPRNWNLSQWFSWRGGLVGIAICLVLVFAFRGCRLLFRILRVRLTSGRRRRRRAARVEVAFYRRLGSILAKRGMVKKDTQTPREFARLAADTLAATPQTRDLAALPEAVVEAFYLVRFGRSPLDKYKQEAVEHALARLHQGFIRSTAIAEPKRNKPK